MAMRKWLQRMEDKHFHGILVGLSYTPWFSDWSNRNRKIRYNSTRPDAASGWYMDTTLYSSDFDMLMTYLTFWGAKSTISM
jgi:hypothetical protein